MFLRVRHAYVVFAQIGLQQYCFLVFLAVCFSVVMYIFLVVPETKNKTFLQIQNEFQSGRKRGGGAVQASTRMTTELL